MLRPILIRASRSRWLADQFRRRRFAKRAVRRFMPGESLEEALDAGASSAAIGTEPVFTRLGEQIGDISEARDVVSHYLSALDAMQRKGVRGQLSVKLTQLGLLQDQTTCLDNVRALATRGAEVGTMVWIDIEESDYVDRTLEVFRGARESHDNVGLCLQSYLYRTPADLDLLLPLHPAIRLVKGAYRESPTVAYPRKEDVDRAYFELGQALLRASREGRALPVFGTHDLGMIERLRAYASSIGTASEAYEVHMLYGIRTAEQRALVRSGARVRVLISYGEHWFPWYMRRLAERPANLWFVAKSMIR
jgi:proline dehydrogenase